MFHLTFYAFPADIGGETGLCLGASLLSAIELIEFLVILVTRKCVKHSHKAKVTADITPATHKEANIICVQQQDI